MQLDFDHNAYKRHIERFKSFCHRPIVSDKLGGFNISNAKKPLNGDKKKMANKISKAIIGLMTIRYSNRSSPTPTSSIPSAMETTTLQHGETCP